MSTDWSVVPLTRQALVVAVSDMGTHHGTGRRETARVGSIEVEVVQTGRLRSHGTVRVGALPFHGHLRSRLYIMHASGHDTTIQALAESWILHVHGTELTIIHIRDEWTVHLRTLLGTGKFSNALRLVMVCLDRSTISRGQWIAL